MGDHAELVGYASDLFNGFKPSSATPREDRRPKFCGSELLYRTADEEGSLAHFAIGYKRGEGLVPPKLSGNRLTNSIANNLEPGLTESFAAFNTCYKDTGLFGFYAQVDEAGVEATIDELLLGVTGLAHTVTEEEAERGKRQLKTLLFGSLDSTTAVAEDIGRQLLVYGRRIPISELSERIDAVDATELRRVAKRYLCDVDIAVTALGPLQQLPPISELRARTSATRC